MTDIPDETLMLAWKHGDGPAFDALYARYRQPLFSYFYRAIGHRAQAEEVFQELWLTLIRRRQSYSVTASFRTYIFCIAHSRLHDFYRRRNKAWRSESPEMDGEIDDVPACELGNPDERLAADQELERLHFCLQQLPPEQRSVMLLRLEADLTLQVIAEQLQVAYETLKSRFRYAQKKLLQCLGGAPA